MKLKNKLGLLTCMVIAFGCDDNQELSQELSQKRFIEQFKNLQPITDVKEKSLLPQEEAVLKKCDSILNALCEKGVKAAFKEIREISPLPSSELDGMEKSTQEQLSLIEPRYGKILGYEKVIINLKGKSVMECVYIVKCETHIIRWRFFFYKPKDKWFLNTFFWDDKIQDL